MFAGMLRSKSFASCINICTLFQAALSLPESHKNGKLSAYQLLCNSTIQRIHDIPLEDEHLAQFYTLLHLNLHSSDQVSIAKFFALRPVSTCSLEYAGNMTRQTSV